MTRQEREELNQMSKRVFGTTSRWKKIIDHGVAEDFERDREVMLPRANGHVVKKVYTDKKSVIRHYTVAEVRKLMEDILTKRAGEIATAAATSAPSVQLSDLGPQFEKGATVTLTNADGTTENGTVG